MLPPVYRCCIMPGLLCLTRFPCAVNAARRLPLGVRPSLSNPHTDPELYLSRPQFVSRGTYCVL